MHAYSVEYKTRQGYEGGGICHNWKYDIDAEVVELEVHATTGTAADGRTVEYTAIKDVHEFNVKELI